MLHIINHITSVVRIMCYYVSTLILYVFLGDRGFGAHIFFEAFLPLVTAMTLMAYCVVTLI